MLVVFYDLGTIQNDLFKYAIIACKYEDEWVFVQHKEKQTWEIPGGRRELGEDINDTAKRELQEETGALNFTLYEVCDYSVTKGSTSYGRLFYAEIQELGALPDLEIGQITQMEDLPKTLTYPEIQPLLLQKIKAFIAGRNLIEGAHNKDILK